MLLKILRPFFFLILFVSVVGFSCGTSDKTATDSPTTNQNGDTPTEEVTTNSQPTTEVATGTGHAAKSLDDVQNATIQIVAEGTSVDPQEGTQLNAGWAGSGFFIDSSGLAVTNNHVVTGAAILKVFVGGDSTEHSARVVGVSECSDLAVIQVDAEDFNYLEWYDGALKTGMEVYAAGYPLAEPEFNLTKGIISKTAADGQTSWSSIKSVIGHDATINPGNSGGPLVTTDGKVVGVNYRGRSEANQYFAIGANVALPVIKELSGGTNVDSIGVNGEAFSFGPNNEYPGIWAYSVESGSPAAKAGIKAGDIILEMENILLSTDGTYKEYCDVLRGHSSDETMSIRVYRPSTDEILEGQLNGDELVNAGYGGLTSGSNTTTTNNNTTASSGTFATEFETDYLTEGWYEVKFGKEPETSVTQKPGRLIMKVNTKGSTLYLLNENFSASDVVLTTQATKVSGPNTMAEELVCRASDAGWYEFGITVGGQWFIWKYDPNAGDGGYFYTLKQGASKYIALEKHTNYITASCIGTTLTLSVNDHQIAQVEDRDIAEGQVGIAVTTGNIRGAEIEFENFTATAQ